jgi:hypothetical protein
MRIAHRHSTCDAATCAPTLPALRCVTTLAAIKLMAEAPHPAAEDATEVPPLSPAPTPVRNVAFTLISVAIVVLLLQLMQSVLIPFVLGGLLFYALDPAGDRLQKMRVPRALGAAAMLLIVVRGCGALAYSLQGQALPVIDQLPVGARKLAATLRRTPGATPGAIEKVRYQGPMDYSDRGEHPVACGHESNGN